MTKNLASKAVAGTVLGLGLAIAFMWFIWLVRPRYSYR